MLAGAVFQHLIFRVRLLSAAAVEKRRPGHVQLPELTVFQDIKESHTLWILTKDVIKDGSCP